MLTLEKVQYIILTQRARAAEVFRRHGEVYYEGKVDAYDVVLEQLDHLLHREIPELVEGDT